MAALALSVLPSLFCTPHRRAAGLALTAALALSACGGGGGGADPTAGTGSLRLALTDAPACGFDAVHVTVDKVRVHRSSTAGDNDPGWSELVLSPPRRIDLLTLTNGVLHELGQMPLPAGKYTQLRLLLAANGGAQPLANAVVPQGGAEVALRTPSGQPSGVKANIDIDIAPDRMADFVLDFDACRSVVTAGGSGQYLLKPVVSVIPRWTSGVRGQVVPGTATSVSLQRQGEVVRATAPDASGQYLLQPVEPGSYTLVLAAAGRTTAVVTQVPVAADTVTTVGAAAQPLALPASPVATVQGTAPAGALVRGLQAVAGAGSVEVAFQGVDGVTGAYAFTLPTAPPLVAPYAVAPAPLVFAPDAAAAGRYTLQARLAGAADQQAALPVLAPGAVQTTVFPFR